MEEKYYSHDERPFQLSLLRNSFYNVLYQLYQLVGSAYGHFEGYEIVCF
jgi:hypothetical protein